MSQARIVLLFLLPCYVVALNECDTCDCCTGGFQRCQYSQNTGHYCLDGCIEGHFGTLCQQICMPKCRTCLDHQYCTACSDGYYGSDCNKCLDKCQTCTSTFICQKCKAGFYNGRKYELVGYNHFYDCRHKCRDNCESCTSYSTCTTCITGKYGINCQSNCGRGCKDNLCDHNDGTCPCMPGFIGNKCEFCEHGSYGALCMLCPKGCLNDYCDSNGNCNQCKPFLSGNKCDQCTNRNYGDNCDKNCPANCVQCSSDTKCSSCDQGYYGQICNSPCQKDCRNSICDKLNGSCLSCNSGLHGSSCDKICPKNCAGNVCSQYGGLCKMCVNGYYGSNCNQMCPYCKPGTACPNGICSECADGFYYSSFYSNCDNRCYINCKVCNGVNWNCSACVDGKYGKYCYSDCSNNCLNKRCDKITGHCEYGCVDGYWGDKCSTTCSRFCKENKCFASNGTCAHGCLEGYKGPTCNCHLNCNCNEAGHCYECTDNYEKTERNCACSKGFCSDTTCTECSDSSYYLYRATCCRCSATCKKNECTSAFKCLNGCVEGYSGGGCLELCINIDKQCKICTQDFTASSGGCLKCEQGYYPDAITRQCVECPGNCADDTCSPLNGSCKAGCKHGKWDIKCDKNCAPMCARCSQIQGKCSLCKDGKYLNDCSKECSKSCNDTNGIKLCALEDGSCLNGCETVSKFGTHCEKNCSINCLNSKCEFKTGNCLDGCRGNFYGHHCDNRCDINCLRASNGKICNDVSGHCINGCNDGYYGDLCNQRCSKYCANITCNKESGECFHGCLTGYTGSSCTMAARHTDKDGLYVTVGAAVGALIFVILILVVIGVVCLKRRHRRKSSERNDLTELNDNTDNPVTDYSEIVTTGLSVEQNATDAVYALHNKPKKHIGDENKSNFSSTSTASTHNYEKSQTSNDDFVKKEQDRTSAQTASVYNNTVVRPSVARTSFSQKALWHSDDSALEIEEDIASLIRTSKTNSVGTLKTS